MIHLQYTREIWTYPFESLQEVEDEGASLLQLEMVMEFIV
jgi:hypothetical protein